VNGLQEKENLDPLNRGGKKVGLSAKKKKVYSDQGKCSGSTVREKAVMGERIPKKVNRTPMPSENGICTGTLKTRTLPPLPPLEPESTDAPIQLSSAPTPALPPSITEIPRAASPLPAFLASQCADSPASNVDSGYGKLSDSDLEAEGGIDLNDESDMSIEVDTTELNRRARALTESPLAEVRIFQTFYLLSLSKLIICLFQSDHSSFHWTRRIL